MKYSISDSYSILVSKLSSVYERREAANITAIVFEDIFGILNPAASQKVLNDSEYDSLMNILNELLSLKPWQYVLGQADFYLH